MLPRVLGLFGGTFDPPHMGHLAVASAALDQLPIANVRFIPAGEPWQKAGRSVTGTAHRLAMTRLAAADDDRFVVDTVEIDRPGPSYTIDTIRHFGDDVVLILGADAAASIAGLRGVNRIVGDSGLPRVDECALEDVLNRDAFALLGITP
jgi:nicotinate-nucleotide adenylyltransferase